MTSFAVWAPEATKVELSLDDISFAMHHVAGGWWRRVVEEAGHSTRYGFSIDGGPVRPDPRSRWQPDGPHGRSAVLDHDRFSWTDHRWRGISHRGAVIYELHVGTFTPEGTFQAAIDRLPHLTELGVDAVELLPVAEFAGERGWGYDGVDLFAPHHAYGGPEGLKRLVDACHGHGLGVILDVVYNHLGPSGNYLAEFGPYFSEIHETNWGAAINFDGPGSHEVRRLFIDNAVMWLRDYHIDGLRLDAVHAIIDDSETHILEAMAVEVDALATWLNRPLFLIAETDLNNPKFVHSRDADGFGLDAAWADEWHHALHAVLTGERSGYYEDFGSLELLGKALRQAWVYDGVYSPHRGRRHGESPTGLTGHQFVICTQNHDQVGNRARGERSSHLMSEAKLKIAAALLLTAPFTPMLFQGEEWGASTPFLYFTDHQEPHLGQAVSRGRREEFAHFGWDPASIPNPQDPNTFLRSKLKWSELQRETHETMLDWYRDLVELRRRLPSLADPRLDYIEVETKEETRTIEVRRGTVRVLVNLGAELAVFRGADTTIIHAASDPAIRGTGTGVAMPPDAVAIVEDSEHD